MTNHASTPYRAQGTAGHDLHGQAAIYGEDGKSIALVYDGEANAEFIVTACNSFEAVRDALSDCVECLTRLNDAEGAYRVTCLTQARAALDLA